jgi:hypothetical protein
MRYQNLKKNNLLAINVVTILYPIEKIKFKISKLFIIIQF